VTDSKSQHPGSRHIALSHRRNTGARDARRGHRKTKGQLRNDGKLVSRIDSLDVVARVGFGITEPLRSSQRIVESRAFFHGRENRRARPVDDARNRKNLISRQRLVERSYDRNRTGYRALEAQRRAA
jgi:hypothetical protein